MRVQTVIEAPLPRAPFLFAILLRGHEAKWAKRFPNRVLLRFVDNVVVVVVVARFVLVVDFVVTVAAAPDFVDHIAAVACRCHCRR
jgi:hypothetical protein